jgi:N-acetyllactosaminide 3-alpha-galactosyltransferase
VGGVETHVFKLSRALVRLGHEVEVLTSNVPRTQLFEVLDGIRIRRFPALDLPYIPIVPGLSAKISRFKGDLVHSHCPPPFFSYSINSKPHVVTYHCDVEIPPSFRGLHIPGGVSRLVEVIHEKYGERIVEGCDRVIATGEGYAETSRLLKGVNWSVIPNGIDLEDFPDKGWEREEEKILFVGRLSFPKGVHYLVKAMPLVLRELPEAKLTIVGDGEERLSLMRLVKILNLEEKIDFLGYISHDDLVKEFYTSAITVLPSISRLEAFGIVLLESMACKTPVIASDIPGVRDIAQEGGILCRPGDPLDLAIRIIEILGDKPLRKRLGEVGFRAVEAKYTWNEIAKKITMIYEDLV